MKISYKIIINLIISASILYSRGVNFGSLIYCVFSIVMLQISIVDFKTRTIPKKYLEILLYLSVFKVSFYYKNAIDHIVSFVIILSVMFIVYMVTSGVIAGGDCKLMAIIGFAIGLKYFYISMLIGTVFCGAYVCIISIIKKKNVSKVPFSPFLHIGFVIFVIFEEFLIRNIGGVL